MVAKMYKSLLSMVKFFISIKAKSGANLTVATKNSIVNSLKTIIENSVRPVNIDPETIFYNFKYIF